jgi:hypothetical protein
MATPITSPTHATTSVIAALGAVICGLLTAFHIVCAISDEVRASVGARWGRTGRSGAPVSAFGHLAWAVNTLGFAMLLTSKAFDWPTPVQHLLFAVMLCALGLLLYACWRDS